MENDLFCAEILECLEVDEDDGELLDGLMLEVSQTYETSVTNSPPTASAIASARASSSPTHSPSVARFAAPKGAAEIETARQNKTLN